MEKAISRQGMLGKPLVKEKPLS
ncbi:uncharacterized protein G2W53_008354 [Senna tora]|uniref:Uncharacterized protein n=1 Tax=Senna tora TaxID=362788 RepID=A0A834X8I3_9FABA|nr:uncharacterized protein G2W53_008354 [Senna tora]